MGRAVLNRGFALLLSWPRYKENHDLNPDEKDPPLPGTLRFVFVMGISFLIGWFGLFLLLKERW